jgi:hypothetical protein
MPQIWCQCHTCIALGPQGRSFSKADYKIHQLRLQHEGQDRLFTSQTAVENELFARSVADSDTVTSNAPSAMWNSREHIQAQTSDKSSSPDSAGTTTTASIVADSIRRLTLSSHREPSSSHRTDDLAEILQGLDISDTCPTPATPTRDFVDGFAPNTTDSQPPTPSSNIDTPNLPNIMDSPPSPSDPPAPNRHLHIPHDK